MRRHRLRPDQVVMANEADKQARRVPPRVRELFRQLDSLLDECVAEAGEAVSGAWAAKHAGRLFSIADLTGKSTEQAELIERVFSPSRPVLHLPQVVE